MADRPITLVGLGNSIIDILAKASDEQFRELALEKGTMRLTSLQEQDELLGRVVRDQPVLASGGSVANSIIAFAQLGGSAGFLGSVGSDEYGRFYSREMEGLGIAFPNPLKAGKSTGTCLALITPDAERTMRTCLGVSGELDEMSVNAELIATAEWLFIEGYLLANPDAGVPAVRKAISVAKESGTKIAFTLSEPWIVDSLGDLAREVVAASTLVFCNEFEAQALSGCATVEAAFEALSPVVPQIALTAGPKGAYLSDGRERVHVPATPCQPKDLTGAGDMFAGAYLFGRHEGLPMETAGRAACFMAAQVISQVGARLSGNILPLWSEALAR